MSLPLHTIDRLGGMMIDGYQDPQSVLSRAQEEFREVMVDTARLENATDYRMPCAQTRLEYAIEDIVLLASSGRKPGVAVILAPSGTGKSIAAKHVAQNCMRRRILRGVVYFKVVDTEHALEVPLSVYFANLINITLPKYRSLLDLIPKRKEDEESQSTEILLIFDQVDRIYDHPDFDHFFSAMGTASHNAEISKRFHCLALCNTSQTAERLLLLNGGQKLYAPIHGRGLIGGSTHTDSWRSLGVKLSRDEATEIVRDRLRVLMGRDEIEIDELMRIHETLVNCARIAGTIQFCMSVAEELHRVISLEVPSTLENIESEAYRVHRQWAFFSEFVIRSEQRATDKLRDIFKIQNL